MLHVALISYFLSATRLPCGPHNRGYTREGCERVTTSGQSDLYHTDDAAAGARTADAAARAAPTLEVDS